MTSAFRDIAARSLRKRSGRRARRPRERQAADRNISLGLSSSMSSLWSVRRRLMIYEIKNISECRWISMAGGLVYRSATGVADVALVNGQHSTIIPRADISLSRMRRLLRRRASSPPIFTGRAAVPVLLLQRRRHRHPHRCPRHRTIIEIGGIWHRDQTHFGKARRRLRLLRPRKRCTVPGYGQQCGGLYCGTEGASKLQR